MNLRPLALVLLAAAASAQAPSGAAAAPAQAPPAAAPAPGGGPLTRHYRDGETLTYHMTAANDDWRYTADASSVAKKTASGGYIEEFRWDRHGIQRAAHRAVTGDGPVSPAPFARS